MSLSFSIAYPPSLSGINQYGCFSLPFRDIARIEIYTGGRESAPMPTPLPDIHWPKPEGVGVPFFGEGLRGAFPMSVDMQRDSQLFAASEFGLSIMNAGDDWYGICLI